MDTIDLTHIDTSYINLLKEKQWDRYIDCLCEDGLSWWFNIDVLPIIYHLAPLQSFPKSKIPLRLELLSAAVSSENSLDKIEYIYNEFVKQKDISGIAATCIAGFNCVWNTGFNLKMMDLWLNRIDTLLSNESEITDTERAALLTTYGGAEIVRWGKLKDAEKTLIQALHWAEKAKAHSLRIYAAYAYAYSLIWQGDFAKLEVLDADISPLCTLPNAAIIPVSSYRVVKGFYYLLLGNTSKCKRLLKETIAHPFFDFFPSSIWLVAYVNLLLAYAYDGNLRKVDGLSKIIQKRVVPNQNNFHHGYVHFSLGTAAFVHKQPIKSLIHCQECESRTVKSGSPILLRVCALLKGQALIDSGNTDDALSHLTEWMKRWIKTSHNLLAAQGALELSFLFHTIGDIESSKRYYITASNLIPQLSIVPNPHRGDLFSERLENMIFPGTSKSAPWLPLSDAKIQIMAFGKLKLKEVNQGFIDKDESSREVTLLKAIISAGGENVSIDWLMDAMWPESDGDRAYGNLKVVLHRLRNLIQTDSKKPPLWIIVKNRRVSLSKSLCSADALIFIDTIKKAKDRVRNFRDCLCLLDLYKEDFLIDDDRYPWIISFRNKLRKSFIDAALSLVDFCAQENQLKAALTYLKKATELDPTNELLYAELMNIYLRLKMPSMALKTYESAENELSRHFDISPGSYLKSIREKAKQSYPSSGI